MPDVSKLKELIQKQNELAEEIAAETTELSGDKLLIDLERLKLENEILRGNYSESASKVKALNDENAQLKESLQNLMQSERARFLNRSKEKVAAYFRTGMLSGTDVLERFEHNAKGKFDKCRSFLDLESGKLHGKFDGRIQTLENEILDETERLRQGYREAAKNGLQDNNEQSGSLVSEPVDERTAKEVTQQVNNKVERLVGLNLLGKIGAVLILIGMVVLAQFLYTQLPHIVSCILMFFVASATLGTGLFLNRKKTKRTVFSITILALGVALEYTALTVTYFVLGILNMWVALAVCVVITAVSFFISLKLKNEVVAMFAQIGGYLPIIAVMEAVIGQDMLILYGAMIYFLILNILGFVLSSRHKWQKLNYTAFGLNMVAVIAVAVSVAVMYSAPGLETMLTLAFMLISFSLHTMLPLVTNIRISVHFTKSDFVLMTLTTSINLVLFYSMFHLYGLAAYTGWLSLFFAAFYFGLYFFARKFFLSGMSVSMMFWMTGVVFLVLFMPMHFGLEWINFGWILQSAVLVIYGILRERKTCFRVGAGLSAVSLLFFLVSDLLGGKNIVGGVNIFIYKYLMITLVSIVVLGVLIYKQKLVLGYLTADGQVYRSNTLSPVQLYAGVAYLNAAGFLSYLIYKIFDFSAARLIQAVGTTQYAMFALILIVLFVFATVVPKLFQAYAVRLASLGVAGFSLLFLVAFNATSRLPTFGLNGDIGGKIGASLLIAATVIFSMYVFYDLVIKIANLAKTQSQSWVFMISALYFLFWFTFVFLWQYRLAFTNLFVSIIYILTALLCVALGLYFRNVLTRRFALVLTGFSIFKIFVIDTMALDTISRIVNFFVFGVVLIGMSFLYQLFYKKFNKKEEYTIKKK